MSPRRLLEVLGGGGLAGSPCILLVAWESYMTPSRTVTPIYIVPRINAKIVITEDIAKESTLITFCSKYS
jgi:hypothetical protein